MNSLAPHMLPSSNMKSIQRQKVMWWHDAIIDLMLAEPNLTKKEIAVRLGKAYSTIAIVTASDVFRHRLAMRRAEHSRLLSEDLINNTTRVANKALELTMERLESGDAAKIPALQLFSLADKALERLGFGVKPQGGVTVNVQQNTSVSAPADAISQAQRHIRERELAARATAVDVVEPPAATNLILDLEKLAE